MQQDDVSLAKDQILRNSIVNHHVPKDCIFQSTFGHGDAILFDPTSAWRPIHNGAFTKHILN